MQLIENVGGLKCDAELLFERIVRGEEKGLCLEDWHLREGVLKVKKSHLGEPEARERWLSRIAEWN